MRPGRRAAIVALVFVAFAALAASAGAAPLVWTAGKDAETVSTIDAATGRVVGAPIKVGGRPESIAITPDGKFAFVGNYDGKTVSVIATTARSILTTIAVPGNPEQIAISPSGTRAYVTVSGSAEITVISTVTDMIVGTVKVVGEASALAVSPDGTYLYVSSGPGTVEVVDTRTGQVVGPPIAVGHGPQSIVFAPNGAKAYVSSYLSKSVTVIDTALGQAVGSIELPGGLAGLAVSPDGKSLYVADEDDGTVSIFETETDRQIGKPIATGTETQYIAITPDGSTAFVSAAGAETVTPIDLATGLAQKPIPFSGETADLAVTPDQSPTAEFTAPSAFAGAPAAFSGAASTDPDGTIAAWNWTFGDGGAATGSDVSHTYGLAGSYQAKLGVVDNEGCGEAEVFTGRTAYCSGNPTATQTVTVARAPNLCSSRFNVVGVAHNRRNGTVRLRIRVPAAGALYLFGMKVHAVTRKSVRQGVAYITLHARVEVNKRLKKVHHIPVRYRVTYYPAAGCSPITTHSSVALLRAPRKKTHRGR